MTAAEKRAMFEHITASPARGAVKSPWTVFSFNTWVMQHRVVSVAFAAILIVVLAGGGVASASMSALPGDSLYAVKVSVVEPIRVALASTPVAKAEVQAQLADNRLKEAETLAAQGKLDDTKKNQIATLIDAHTEALSQALDQVSQNSPAEANAISNSFEASAQAHVLALRDLTGETAISVQNSVAPVDVEAPKAAATTKPVTMSASFAPVASAPIPSSASAQSNPCPKGYACTGVSGVARVPSVATSNAQPVAMMSAIEATASPAVEVSVPEVPVVKMAAKMTTALKVSAVPTAVTLEATTSSDSIINAVDASINRLRLSQRVRAKAASSTDSTATSSIKVRVNGKSINVPNVNGATSIQVTATSSGTTNGSVNVEVQTDNGSPVHTVIQNTNGAAVQIEQTINANSSVNVGM